MLICKDKIILLFGISGLAVSVRNMESEWYVFFVYEELFMLARINQIM
jgi:hypothetical protein